VDAGFFSAQPFHGVYERTISFTDGQQVISDQYAVALAETSPSAMRYPAISFILPDIGRYLGRTEFLFFSD